MPSDPASKSSTLVLQTLKWARDKGYVPLPLNLQSKAVAVKDYLKPDYEPEDDSFWTTRGAYGIGILLGPQRKGPIDIDLDCEEAILLAPYLLPHTDAVFGRPGKPKSHYVYSPEDEAFETLVLRDRYSNTNIVEIRGDGGNQTVFPGSLHETTGELIEWSVVPFPEPPRVSREALVRATRLMAIGVIILRHIWSDGFRNDPTLPLAGILAKFGWTREEAHTLFDALAEVTDKHDKSRTKTINITYNAWEADKPVTGIPRLRSLMGEGNKDQQLKVDALLEVLGMKSVEKIEKYNTKYACVMMNGQRIFRTDVKPTEAPEPMDKQLLLDWEADDITFEDGKATRWASVWLSSPQRRKYPKGMDFLPGIDTDTDERYFGTFNLWNGWKFELPEEKPKDYSCSAWLDLVHTIITGDEQHADWVINWLADILINPMDVPRTSLVMKGSQGTGKTLSLSYFGSILGDYYLTAQHDEQIVGRFNSHLARTLLLHSEEALWAGNHKHRGILKSLITDEWRMWEAKNVNAKQIRNLMRIAMSSNEMRPAPVEIGDRRYMVLDGSNRTLPEKLQEAVVKEFRGSGPQSLFWYLTREYKYDRNKATKIIKTDAWFDVMASGLNPVHAWMYEKLQAGQLLRQGLEWCGFDYTTPWPTVVSSVALYRDFSIWHGSRPHSTQHVSAVTFANQLQDLFQRKLEKGQKLFDEKYRPSPLDDGASSFPREVFDNLSARQYAYVDFPTLQEARVSFEKRVGKLVDWGQPLADKDTPAYLKSTGKPKNDTKM